MKILKNKHMSTFEKEDNFYKLTFDHLNYSGDFFEDKEFEECIFTKCSFIECTFKHCKFLNCTFVECTLSAIKPINSSFNEVVFKESKVIGFDWTKATSIRSLAFEKSQLTYSNFSQLKLPLLKIRDSVAHEVNFSEAHLFGGDFQGTDFLKAVFSQTNLSKANFRKAFNYSINFKYNNISKAKFSLPEAMSLLNSLEIELEG